MLEGPNATHTNYAETRIEKHIVLNPHNGLPSTGQREGRCLPLDAESALFPNGNPQSLNLVTTNTPQSEVIMKYHVIYSSMLY